MKESRTLKKLEQIRILAHPLRMQLLEAFARRPLTTKQVAELLGEQPTKLYHHVDALEHAGLIKLVRTCKKRGTLEKYYRAAATHFNVDHKLFVFKPQAKEAMGKLQSVVTSMLEETLAEVRQFIAEKFSKPGDKRNQAILIRSHVRATPAQIKVLNKKINNLMKMHENKKSMPGAVDYGLTLVMYPVKAKEKTKKVS